MSKILEINQYFSLFRQIQNGWKYCLQKNVVIYIYLFCFIFLGKKEKNISYQID